MTMNIDLYFGISGVGYIHILFLNQYFVNDLCQSRNMCRLGGLCCPLSKWLSLSANIAKSKGLTTNVGLHTKWIQCNKKCSTYFIGIDHKCRPNIARIANAHYHLMIVMNSGLQLPKFKLVSQMSQVSRIVFAVVKMVKIDKRKFVKKF